MRRILLLFLLVLLARSLSAQDKPLQLENLSVTHMTRASYYAGSSVPDKEAFGGFGSSGNYPRKIDENNNFPRNAISLIAQPESEAVFNEKYRGFQLLLVNTTDKEQWFGAVDSHLYIGQEALDKEGVWRPIEAEPASWCGNSYHRVRLGPNEFWTFTAPRYTGSFKTKLRFRSGVDAKSAVYSSEFDGSVNPGQFVKPKSKFLF